MKGPSLKLSRPPATSEIQSTLSLMDFMQAWFHLRWWYLIGLFLVCLATYLWNRQRTPYYRAESKIFVGRIIIPEQRIGLSDLSPAPIGRNDQFINLVNAGLAEQYL